MSEIWLSLSGFFGLSAATNCLISARTAVLDALPPVSVPRPEPKKYFSSKVPNGVAMYLAVVTRLMVDSCRPSSSAISRSTSGRMASSPCTKKLFCRSTMALDDAQDGVEALLDVLDEPARLLQALLQRLAALALVLAQALA